MKITKRKIAWGVVLLILIVGGVICKKRWNVWFYNIPEIRYVLTEEPQRVLLTFGNDGELSRNVSWVCGGVLGRGLSKCRFHCAHQTDVSFSGKS